MSLVSLEVWHVLWRPCWWWSPGGTKLAFVPACVSLRTSELPVSVTLLRWSCLLHSRVSIYCSRQGWQTPLSQQMVLLGKQTVVMRLYLSNETAENRFNPKHKSIRRRKRQKVVMWQWWVHWRGWSKSSGIWHFGLVFFGVRLVDVQTTELHHQKNVFPFQRMLNVTYL